MKIKTILKVLNSIRRGNSKAILIINDLGVNKSNLSRYLSELVRNEYLIKNKYREYSLTPKAAGVLSNGKKIDDYFVSEKKIIINPKKTTIKKVVKIQIKQPNDINLRTLSCCYYLLSGKSISRTKAQYKKLIMGLLK